MQASKQILLETLREQLKTSFPSGQKTRETLPFSMVEGGIPKGALTEVSGAEGCGKTELVLRFLAENSTLRVAWIEEDFSAYPCAFSQNGVGLERVLFVDCDSSEHSLWSAHQILRSQVFEAVILKLSSKIANPDRQGLEEVDLKRLQLLAEKSGTCLFLVLEEPLKSATWPITLRLQVTRDQTLPEAASSTPEASCATASLSVQKNRQRNSAPHEGAQERRGVWQSTG